MCKYTDDTVNVESSATMFLLQKFWFDTFFCSKLCIAKLVEIRCNALFSCFFCSISFFHDIPLLPWFLFCSLLQAMYACFFFLFSIHFATNIYYDIDAVIFGTMM